MLHNNDPLGPLSRLFHRAYRPVPQQDNSFAHGPDIELGLIDHATGTLPSRNLANLPPELLHDITTYLQPRDLFRLAQTNQQLRAFVPMSDGAKILAQRVGMMPLQLGCKELGLRDEAARAARRRRVRTFGAACLSGAAYLVMYRCFVSVDRGSWAAHPPKGYHPISAHITPEMCAALDEYEHRACLMDMQYQWAERDYDRRVLGLLGTFVPVTLWAATYGLLAIHACYKAKRPKDTLGGSFKSLMQATAADRLKVGIDEAVRVENLPILNHLLYKYPSFPWIDPAEGSVLEYALRNHWSVTAVKILLDMQQVPTVHELDLAVELHCSREVFEALLSSEHVRAQWRNIATAIDSDDPVALGHLLETLSEDERAIVATTRFENGNTLLCAAARQVNAVVLLRPLLANGACINDACVERRRTPLHWAVIERRADAVGFLLAAGANPSLRDARGNSSIDLAEYATPEIATLFAR